MEREVRYLIQQELEPDSGRWHTICTCITPEGCAEVIRVLLKQEDPPTHYRIEIVRP